VLGQSNQRECLCPELTSSYYPQPLLMCWALGRSIALCKTREHSGIWKWGRAPREELRRKRAIRNNTKLPPLRDIGEECHKLDSLMAVPMSKRRDWLEWVNKDVLWHTDRRDIWQLWRVTSSTRWRTTADIWALFMDLRGLVQFSIGWLWFLFGELRNEDGDNRTVECVLHLDLMLV
jgi:hypothetical protein